MDLEKYVLQVDLEKKNLLLVNKADLMTLDEGASLIRRTVYFLWGDNGKGGYRQERRRI